MRGATVEEEAEKALLIEDPCCSWKDERSLDLIPRYVLCSWGVQKLSVVSG